MGARYKKHEKVSRGIVKTTKAAEKSTLRGQTNRPTKVITMGKKIKITSRTPKSQR